MRRRRPVKRSIRENKEKKRAVHQTPSVPGTSDMIHQNRRKIAVVIPKYGLLGGAEGHTAEITERLARDPRFEVHVFANKWTGSSEHVLFHKVPIVTFPKYLTTISFAYFAGAQISRMNFDVIHAHERIFTTDVCTLHWIPHRIWTRDVRGKKIPSLFDRGTIWVEEKMIRGSRCRKMIAVSDLARGYFLQAYPRIDPAKVEVIHPGVNLDAFTKLDRQKCRSEIRQQYGIAQTDVVCIFVSMNYDIKGLDYLMTGLASVKKMRPRERFKLFIVGKSDNRKYVSLAREIGVTDDIIYTGTVPHDCIPRLYLAADVFSMPSRFDTFGLTVLEAMAASLPVIISGHVGAKDLIAQGVNGFIVNQEHPADGIAEALDNLCDPDVRQRMSREAFITASRHPWEKAAEQYAEVYDAIYRENLTSQGCGTTVPLWNSAT